jgi:hypothetical protein
MSTRTVSVLSIFSLPSNGYMKVVLTSLDAAVEALSKEFNGFMRIDNWLLLGLAKHHAGGADQPR